MIPVTPAAEPTHFDTEIRQPGLQWLTRNGIHLDRPLPRGQKLKPYWRRCLTDLHTSYRGMCAYLGVYFERITGGGSVDHFVPKSQRADQAYEWLNFRLACMTMNSRKGDVEDVLDPFDVQEGWFRLELVSGRIYPDSELPESLKAGVQAAIDRLGLDDPACREIRTRHFDELRNESYTESYLKRISPFVWHEARRQGLL